jgi:plastocyanin
MLRALVLALFAAPLTLPVNAPSAAPGEVRGSVLIGAGERAVPISRLGPAVVLLEGLDGALDAELPTESCEIRQRDAHFQPDFLAIAVGQTVDFPNDDEIFHNVFSYSGRNTFDLGLYRDGTGKSMTFEHPGVVRIYCSIHESMNALIYVAPTPYFTLVDEAGEFRIAGVPPGRYRLRVWSDRVVERFSEVTVKSGSATDVPIRIEPEGSGRERGRPSVPPGADPAAATTPSTRESSLAPARATDSAPLAAPCCREVRR